MYVVAAVVAVVSSAGTVCPIPYSQRQAKSMPAANTVGTMAAATTIERRVLKTLRSCSGVMAGRIVRRQKKSARDGASER